MIRKRIENAIGGAELPAAEKRFFFVVGLASNTLIYKGMLTADQMGPMFPDLLDEEMESALDMNAIADRRTAGFSHGERTKVALARALVHNPQNVLLDEPTTGLDVMATRSVRDIIRQLRSEGRCVLFSSHVMQEVAALADTIVVIAHGRIAASGTPDEILSRAGRDNLEDAFVALRGLRPGFVTVRVRERAHDDSPRTAAEFEVSDPDEFRRLLELIAERRERAAFS